jgi:hypothetical protein
MKEIRPRIKTKVVKIPKPVFNKNTINTIAELKKQYPIDWNKYLRYLNEFKIIKYK